MWAAVCWVIVLWKLHAPALMDPDEAHYAQLTREMLAAGDWMVPLLDGRPFIDKPVLFHWLQGLAVTALGETETAIRLPSALAALALFWLTYWTGTQLLDKRVGDRGSLMVATLPMTFMLGSLGVFDMVFTVFMFGAIAVAIVSVVCQRPRLEYLAYVLLSLAVMTKGPVALVLAGAFFVAGLVCGRHTRTALLSLHWKTGALISVALSLPWFLWMYHVLGWYFVHQYFYAGNLYYVTQPQSFSNRAFNHTLYVSTFLAGFFPWSIITLGAAVDAARRLRDKSRLPAGETLLWVWIAVVFILFSLARFKVDRYLYPAAPACCLLAARAWLSVSVTRVDLLGARDNIGARWSIALVAILLIAAGVFGGFALFDLGLELPRAAVLMPLSFAAGGVAVALVLATRRAVSPALFGGVIAMLLVIYGSVVAIGLPIFARARPTAEVAQGLRTQLAPDDQVGLYRLEKWRFSLRYYLDRPVSRLQHTSDVQDFFSNSERGYVLMLDEDFASLRREGVNLRSVSERPAVTGTTGRGLRKQKWGSLVVATLDDTPRTAEPAVK
jgi:4-amino-4-deoxy-L-arabinose transferase-like glycosyltransferase